MGINTLTRKINHVPYPDTRNSTQSLFWNKESPTSILPSLNNVSGNIELVENMAK